jgi:hypothetical protein
LRYSLKDRLTELRRPDYILREPSDGIPYTASISSDVAAAQVGCLQRLNTEHDPWRAARSRGAPVANTMASTAFSGIKVERCQLWSRVVRRPCACYRHLLVIEN